MILVISRFFLLGGSVTAGFTVPGSWLTQCGDVNLGPQMFGQMAVNSESTFAVIAFIRAGILSCRRTELDIHVNFGLRERRV